MTENLVTPDKTITIASKQFLLFGNFGTLRDIQHAFGRDIIDVQGSILNMRQDEIAKLIAIGTQAEDVARAEETIGSLILDELDISGIEYTRLKVDLLTWLGIAMTPKRDREKKRATLAAIIARIPVQSGSLGTTASESQPAS